jgi:hypothetical protein
MILVTQSTRLVAVVLGCVLALGATGCAGSRAASTPQVEPPAAPSVTRMEPERAAAQIASNFPVEVPVAMGEVISGKAQGTDAWDYELRVAAPVNAVAEWYLAEYQRRSGQLADQQTTGASIRLTLRKGGAESQITVEPSAIGDGSTTVRAILGVGPPVLDIQ